MTHFPDAVLQFHAMMEKYCECRTVFILVHKQKPYYQQCETCTEIFFTFLSSSHSHKASVYIFNMKMFHKSKGIGKINHLVAS